MLSSVVAVLCRAKRLVILSDIDGFYDSDPRLHPNAQLIEQIDTIDESVYSLAGGAGSRRGTGGMRTKLQAAQLATSNGIDTIVTNGKRPEALYDIVKGSESRHTVHREIINSPRSSTYIRIWIKRIPKGTAFLLLCLNAAFSNVMRG